MRALILTHEHTDHVSGISVWVKIFNGPLCASEGTVDGRKYLSCLDFETFTPGDALEVAGVRIGTFPTSQDVEALSALVSERTEHVVAMHISQENNRPSLAVRAHLARRGEPGGIPLLMRG